MMKNFMLILINIALATISLWRCTPIESFTVETQCVVSLPCKGNTPCNGETQTEMTHLLSGVESNKTLTDYEKALFL